MRRHLLVVLVLAAVVPTQEPASPGPTGEQLVGALRASLKRPAAPEASAGASEAVDAAIAAIEASPKALDHEQWFAAAQMLFRVQQAERCIHVCELALANQEDPSGLLDFLGMSHIAAAGDAATDVAMREHAVAAEKAFRRAREGKVVTIPAHVFMHQALFIDCRFDEALADYDAVAADGRFADHLPDARRARGLFLTCAGRWEEALAVLQDEDIDAETRSEQEPLLIRALAMAGQTAKSVEIARARWGKQPDATNLALLADALGADAKFDEALQLLRDHPVEEIAGDPWNVTAIRRQSRATFEYLLSLHDVNPKDLREQLARRLGHRPQVLVGKVLGDGSIKLDSSPLIMGATVRKAPMGAKGWGNDLLLLLCVVDAKGHVPFESEAALTSSLVDEPTREALTGEGAKTRAIRILHGHLFMDHDEGTLVALRIAARL